MATRKSTTARTAKKSAAGEGSATTRKQAARKPSGKKTAARAESSGAGGERASGRSRSQRGSSAAEVAQRAAAQLTELTGRDVEGVTSLERREGGWTAELDVVELRRIPSTTDVLATYEVDLDESGELEGYRRAHRYVRGVAGEE